MLARDIYLHLFRILDPRTKDAVVIDATNVGTVDGQEFTADRMLDIYNEARRVLVSSAIDTYGKERARAEFGGLNKVSTVTFNSTLIAPKPLGYVAFTSLNVLNATGIAVNTPINVLPTSQAQIYLEGRNPWYVDTVSRLFVFEIGLGFRYLGSKIAASSTALLHYLCVDPWSLTDVNASATTVETVDDKHFHKLEQVAQALALEVGSQQLMGLTATLFGGGK
jgi:hypothetical protein